MAGSGDDLHTAVKQVYHPYWKWEEYKAGMWRKVPKSEEAKLLPVAIEFTGDHLKYGAAMNEVIFNWKFSCENALSNLNINRKAWLGYAAVTYKLQIPEYITRMAWGHLTQEQQSLANQQAEQNIRLWELERRSKIIFQNGSEDATAKGYQMRLPLNWSLPDLSLPTKEFA